MVYDISPKNEKPFIPEKRRPTGKYIDAIPAGRDEELANIMGQLIYEAGRLIDKQVPDYRKKWRTDEVTAIGVVRDVAQRALANGGSLPEYDNDENRQADKQFRDMGMRYAQKLTDSGLLDQDMAGALVKDIIHNQLCAKEEEIARHQPVRRGGR